MASCIYGPPNPKTLIPPIIPPPLADFNSWRNSSITPNNYINSSSPVYYSSSSGYSSSIPDYFQDNNLKTKLPQLSEYVTNINPYNVQALAGPNSWTVTEPAGVNSNYGISQMSQKGFFTQFGADGTDYQIFVQNQSPIIPSSTDSELTLGDEVSQHIMTVRDPRAYSYGPTDRVFIDDNTGIPSYFYNDIDSARRIGYIQRNNTNLNCVEGSTNNAKISAQEQFIHDTNSQRLDLQASLMRKPNSEMWQQKVAPISSFKFQKK